KPYFRAVSVFDISQTTGEPLPSIANELKADVANFEIFFSTLKKVSPFPVELLNINSGANGYCDPHNRSIAVKTGMSEAQTIKTCLHEIAHSILHTNSNDEKKDSRTREVEAESIAFVVSNHFGIDTSNYSFGYIAAWSSDKELKELKSSLDTIQKTASKLITEIETAYRELQMSKQNILDSVIHDNEIDLDTEKTCNNSGKAYNHLPDNMELKNSGTPLKNDFIRPSIQDRMLDAKEKVKEHPAKSIENIKEVFAERSR
ncbi:MAG: ImmA/IrrE family metallo-endopeptidase, partial [Clostridiaceae bacterium]|nr:ImmA/IrrE family metallo-endopeptidase [Clostridiaceae bacterium]